MLSNLFIGEWRKITGNRLTTTVFIWSVPLIALFLMCVVNIAALGWEDIRLEYGSRAATSWNEAFVMGWPLVNSDIGRYIVAAFTAIVFASEYQLGTWKNFVPYRRRFTLLLTKFAVIGVLVTIAWMAMTLIVGAGTLILGQISGFGLGEFNGESLRQFLGDYGAQMLLTLGATFIASCYAALAAMFTRSTLASFFVALVFNAAETGILLPLVFLSQALRTNLIAIYTFTPSYNLANLQSYLTSGPPAWIPTTTHEFVNGQAPASSLLILVVWVSVLLGITFWRFNWQDITT